MIYKVNSFYVYHHLKVRKLKYTPDVFLTMQLTNISRIYSIEKQYSHIKNVKFQMIDVLSVDIFSMFSSNFPSDQQINHNYVQAMRNTNVCKHLFCRLMKKETFRYRQSKANVCNDI